MRKPKLTLLLVSLLAAGCVEPTGPDTGSELVASFAAAEASADISPILGAVGRLVATYEAHPGPGPLRAVNRMLAALGGPFTTEEGMAVVASAAEAGASDAIVTIEAMVALSFGLGFPNTLADISAVIPHSLRGTGLTGTSGLGEPDGIFLSRTLLDDSSREGFEIRVCSVFQCLWILRNRFGTGNVYLEFGVRFTNERPLLFSLHNRSSTTDFTIEPTDEFFLRMNDGRVVDIVLTEPLTIPRNTTPDIFPNFVFAWIGSDGRLYAREIRHDEVTVVGPELSFTAAVLLGAL